MEPRSTLQPAELLEHTAWLRALARHLVSDAHAADDVVQMTFVVALERTERPREGLHAWLAGVARNVARQLGRSEARRRRRERCGARLESLPSAGEMTALVETQRMLSAAVLGLAEPYRTAVFMRYFEELTPSQIAERLDVPASTVRVRLKRALETLRQRLVRSYGGDARAWSLALTPLITPPKGESLASAAGPSAALLPVTITMSTQLKLALAAGVLIGASAILWTQLAAKSPSNGPELAHNDAVLLVPAATPKTSTPSFLDERTVVASVPPNGPAAFDPLESDDCCIVGRVLDAMGSPVAGARVDAVDGRPREPEILVVLEEERAHRLTVTDADGGYRVAVLPHRAFLLRVTHPDFAPGTARNAFAGEQRDVVLERGTTLAVIVVVEETGRRLSGAEVHARSIDGFGLPTIWSVSTITDDIGAATLTHLPPGDFLTSVSAAGFASGLRRMTAGENGRLEHEFRLASEAVVTGTVLVAATGDPVVNATVESGGWRTSTDRNGRFRIGGFGASEHTSTPVVASAPGFAPDVVYVALRAAGATFEITLRLRRSVLVVGRVVDAVGTSVAGATVVFRGQFSTNPFTAEFHRGQVITDGYGRFELSRVHSTGKYSLAAQAPGFAASNTQFGPIGEGRERLDLGDVVLTTGGSISGSVRGRSQDTGVPDAVKARRYLGNSRATVASTLVTPHGTFLLDGLEPGTYELALYGWNLQSDSTALVRRTVSLEAGEVRRNVELVVTPPIRGSVTRPDGKPARSARVSLHRAEGEPALLTAQTDGDGAFEIQADGLGPFFVLASDPALFFDPEGRDGVLAGTDKIEIRLRPRDTGHAISGRITDSLGSPVTDVYVHITLAATGLPVARVGIPDNQGWFEIRNLDDAAYDLKIVDFKDCFETSLRDGVEPNGEAIHFQLVRRR